MAKASLTVPPAVTLAFERYCQEVCRLAALDSDQVPGRVYEWTTRLQDNWRAGCEEFNLSTTAAQDRAIELFGKPKELAASLRKPWWLSVITYRRCQVQRFAVVLAYWIFYCGLREQLLSPHNSWEVLLLQEGITTPRDIIRLVLPCLGLALIWRFQLNDRKWERWVLAAKFVASILILLCNFSILEVFFFSSVVFPLASQNQVTELFVLNADNLTLLVQLMVSIPTGMYALVCVLSEVSGWPDRKRTKYSR